MPMTETPVPLPPHIAAAMAARQGQPQTQASSSTSTPSFSSAPNPTTTTSSSAAPHTTTTTTTTAAAQSPSTPATAAPDLVLASTATTPAIAATTETGDNQTALIIETEPSSVAANNKLDQDVAMKDSIHTTPARATGTGTPGGGSRAASQHPEPAQPALPAAAKEHGEEIRRYMNTKVTYTLLAAMKALSRQKPLPPDPLRFLGEYLIQMSEEVEEPKREN
ncbi:hypothetical protein MKZ38_005014 [Zalerion maritima]|uniref:Uncharacterized protein n=1 Tax=Zalerion maritima TaxID=339359 RepID=A0AAD5RKL5_9PEZI|nr:hypothetical protein MKZ38_005014 [Zalerion maritima]